MSELTKIHILMQADMLCIRLGIDPGSNDLVLFMGDDCATKNVEAVMNWVAEQAGLQGQGRSVVQEELFTRLIEFLESRAESLTY